MMIARWQIDARFGHKQTVIDTLRAWEKDIAPQIGLSPAKRRMLTGSVGAGEATVITEWEVADLGELDRAWAALAKLDAHKKWGKDLEPYVVSGSSHWEVYRVL
ncbi:MAG TPA: hypothetical protein VIH40_14400 [Xanthobacteraceae bacterium]